MSDHLDTRVDRFVARLSSFGDNEAIKDGTYTTTYRQLLDASDAWIDRLRAQGVGIGTVCGFVGEFSPHSIAVFVALMRLKAIAVPLSPALDHELPRLTHVGGLEHLLRLERDGTHTFVRMAVQSSNQLLAAFRKNGHPGLVVFTSGSSGQPKAILHDLAKVLGKFLEPRKGWRTVLFLMMDHFGGINTLLAILAQGGVAICVSERTPDAVCAAIATGQAELLPTTPTFLKLIVASGAWQNYELGSVRLITYGTEPMPESTLERVHEIFPAVQLKQTYGLSEVGVLHSQSPDPKSLWLKVGGKGFETRIVDGVLHIRSASSMVGYLNAPSPIDADGWMNTGDLVEERDGLIRFRGRASEIINVGGQKVFPSEVEAILLGAPNVSDVTVYGVKHPLLGQAIRARVSLSQPEAEREVNERLREFCRERMAKFKVPLRFEVAPIESQISPRIKKRRSSQNSNVPENKQRD